MMKDRAQQAGQRPCTSKVRPLAVRYDCATAPWRVSRVFYCIAFIALLAFTSSVYNQSVSVNALAEDASDRAEVYQALLDLTNPWTVMCVAAHPDDEDGATLTILRRKYGAHTVTLFSTYGEGGQNVIGPELYEELGVIRAKETLRAAEIQGSEPHFLGLRDFGFSKSAEETFRVWGHDEALRRMVLQIRTLRPDVIITNHDTTSGHGHHQATGRLVEEAFAAAADSKRFPEQLKNVGVWQPQRLFVRVNYEGGRASKPPEEQAARTNKTITIDPNERDSVRGAAYAELALHALQQHASQGPWPSAIPNEGAPLIRYRAVRESKRTMPLPFKAKTLLDNLSLASNIASSLAAPTIDGRPLTEFIAQPQRIFAALRKKLSEETISRIQIDWIRRDQIPKNQDPHLALITDRLNKALAAISGIELSLISSDTFLIPQKTTSFRLRVTNNGDRPVRVSRVRFPNWHDVLEIEEGATIASHSELEMKLSDFETPPWAKSNLPHAEHLYDGELFGSLFEAAVVLEIDNLEFKITNSKRLDFAPPVEIANITPSPYVFTPANLNQPLTFRVQLINHQDKPFKGEFGIASPTDSINEVGDDITLEPNAAREFTVRTNVIPVDTEDERRTPRTDFGPIVFSVHSPGSSTEIAERETPVVYSDAHVAPNLRIGYVRSFDDTLRNAINALGVKNKELSVEDIRSGDLREYETIIIDNRAYQAHPELVQANERLLDYVQRGGTLIVFYHKANEWNPDPAQNRPRLAPLSIILGNERVTDENAPVTFNEPQHPLLNLPNKISSEDFKGWWQERGLYYPSAWDKRYKTPLSMSDAGEKPLHGGLLTLDYGKGRYIYTSMVWYRQLRAGVPGAYRMFANMISYGHPVQNRER